MNLMYKGEKYATLSHLDDKVEKCKIDISECYEVSYALSLPPILIESLNMDDGVSAAFHDDVFKELYGINL